MSMVRLADFLKSVFRLRKTNVSILLLFTYLVVGLTYFYGNGNYKYATPQEAGFKDAPQLLEDAWLNLQNITSSYHSYFSRENERVHNYLLNRISVIAQRSSHVNISDDAYKSRSLLLENLFLDGGAVYFESSNIVVKVAGKNATLPGLLLSAHYDAVPTSHGATDDGKGVVSLLGILDHYSRHQPERTLVFNFNNNEEFGLLGAVAFIGHPWFKLVHYVINLEGTGTGGRAALFRTSDISTARIYQEAVKSNPFGNSIFQQGFYQGLVKSETDYRIYESNGLRGFDIAFYKPRDLYHTTRDSIQYTSREALWHMFHTAWQLTEHISRNSLDNNEDPTPAIFFDVAGTFFFSFSSKSLFKWCCVLLVILPVIALQFDLISFNQNRWLPIQGDGWKVSMRLPLSFTSSLLVVRFTEKLLFSDNTFILSRCHLGPLLALSTEFILSNYLILSFFEHLEPSRDFKTTALRQVAMLMWIVLFLCTIMLYKTKYKYTGIYPIVVLYSSISLAEIIGLFGRVLKKRSVRRNLRINNINISSPHGSIRMDEGHQDVIPQTEEEVATGSNVEENNGERSAEATTEGDGQDFDTDERAPLLISTPHRETAGEPNITDSTLNSRTAVVLNYDWSLQFLIAVPLTALIVFESVDLGLDALRQTIQEGAVATLYMWNFVFLGGIILTLPILPFAYKFNHLTAVLYLIAFAVSLTLSLVQAPFTEWAPLKVKFVQNIDINNGTDAIVNVYGRKGGFLQPMLRDLPSVKQMGKSVACQDEINGMERCTYIGYQPNPIDSQGSLSVGDLFSPKIISNDKNDPERSPYAPINVELEINVKENRGCTLWFEDQYLNPRPVRQLIIHRDDNTSDAIKSIQGFTQLQLHKLDFDQQKHRVGIQWLPKMLFTDDKENDDPMNLRITCYWGEYDSESLVNGQHLRKLPAFDELLKYSPLNISYANGDKGLLTVTQNIEL